MTKTDIFVRINAKGSLTSTEPFIRTNGAAGYERELSETRKYIKKYEEQLSKEEEEKYKNPYTIDNLNYYKKELEKFNIVLEIIRLGKKLKELQ
jgi:hypothetical protein